MGVCVKVLLLGFFIVLPMQIGAFAIPTDKIVITSAMPADYQDCFDLLLANRSFYNPLKASLNEKNGCNLPLLSVDDFALPEVRKNLLPVSKPNTEVIIARVGKSGPIVGLVVFQEQKSFKGNILFISRLNVAEGMRGKGIGKALFARAIDFCDRHPAVTRVAGQILANNASMLRLIQVCGFRYTHESPKEPYIRLEVSVAAFRAYTKSLLYSG